MVEGAGFRTHTTTDAAFRIYHPGSRLRLKVDGFYGTAVIAFWVTALSTRDLLELPRERVTDDADPRSIRTAYAMMDEGADQFTNTATVTNLGITCNHP
jgi:hypothetical protein